MHEDPFRAPSTKKLLFVHELFTYVKLFDMLKPDRGGVKRHKELQPIRGGTKFESKLSNPLMTQQARHQTGTTPAAWYELWKRLKKVQRNH